MDLPKLIDSKLLIQANSGGGKSWLIRRILEQTHGKVQQIILDPEGEFGTLREKYDYILAGKGGDTPADPKSAAMLAKRLLELKVSAIIDLYELHPQDRKRFVRLFLEAMVNAPKELWHPVLIVIDEAHTFVPEKGESEAANAVIGLASLGRKRGFGAVLATQRISKLHKDAAAECNNKLIGRTGLDIDRKRAGEELGFTSKDEFLSLRSLKPGEFYAFGPAVSDEVIKVEVGNVETSHPKAGSRSLTEVVPPTDKIKSILGKLADLPAEAQKEAQTTSELRQKIKELTHELRVRPIEKVPQEKIKTIEVSVLKDSQITRLEKVFGKMIHEAERHGKAMSMLWGNFNEIGEAMRSALVAISKTPKIPTRAFAPKIIGSVTYPKTVPQKFNRLVPIHQSSEPDPETKITGGALRMLKVLVSRYPMKLTKSQLATFAKLSPRSGTFGTYFSSLKSRNLIIVEGDLLQASEEGIDFIGESPNPPQTTEEIISMWRENLNGGARRMFDVLIENYPNPVTKEDLGEAVGMTHSSGSFGTYLSILRSNGIAETGREGVKASDNIFI